MTRGHLQLVAPVTAGQRVSNRPIRVLLVEDYARIRQGLGAILACAPEIQVTEERLDSARILDRVQRWHPHVIAVGVHLDGEGGFLLLDQVRREAPGAAVVVLTMQRSAAFAHRALERGASGVVLKDHADSELLPAIEAAALGETYVSPLIAFG